jgi:NAD(P)H-dependent FMN reductase
MRLVLLSGSNVGTRTRTVIDHLARAVADYDPSIEVSVIDLAEKDMVFSDGRNYLEYTGDTGQVARALMEADVIIIGTPIFQASIPATLKNVFDLGVGEALPHPGPAPAADPHIHEGTGRPALRVRRGERSAPRRDRQP